VAEFLLTLDSEIDVQGGYSQETPLMVAIFRDYFDIAKELLRRGARVNIQESHYGHTPLHFAAQKKDKELIEFLLAKGADPAIKNRYGRTPVEEAEKAGNADIAAFLRGLSPK
jgi:ankyrin repeat protein